jgi:hypothetical protein
MDPEWLKILASGSVSGVLGFVLWILWLHHKTTIAEHRADMAKVREEDKLAEKETLLVLGNLTKLLESMPGASKELTNQVLLAIKEAVDQINRHTEEHVKPGRKVSP